MVIYLGSRVVFWRAPIFGSGFKTKPTGGDTYSLLGEAFLGTVELSFLSCLHGLVFVLLFLSFCWGGANYGFYQLFQPIWGFVQLFPPKLLMESKSVDSAHHFVPKWKLPLAL